METGLKLPPSEEKVIISLKVNASGRVGGREGGGGGGVYVDAFSE